VIKPVTILTDMWHSNWIADAAVITKTGLPDLAPPGLCRYFFKRES